MIQPGAPYSLGGDPPEAQHTPPAQCSTKKNAPIIPDVLAHTGRPAKLQPTVLIPSVGMREKALFFKLIYTSRVP